MIILKNSDMSKVYQYDLKVFEISSLGEQNYSVPWYEYHMIVISLGNYGNYNTSVVVTSDYMSHTAVGNRVQIKDNNLVLEVLQNGYEELKFIASGSMSVNEQVKILSFMKKL